MQNVGVWIDTHKAVIVSLNGKEASVKDLISQVESRLRIKGDGDDQSRFGNQYINDEKSKEERHDHQVKSFLKDVIKEVEDAEKIVVFGPSIMKTELRKAIHDNRQVSSKLLGVEPADEMTENQMVAWVKDYFSEKH